MIESEREKIERDGKKDLIFSLICGLIQLPVKLYEVITFKQ